MPPTAFPQMFISHLGTYTFSQQWHEKVFAFHWLFIALYTSTMLGCSLYLVYMCTSQLDMAVAMAAKNNRLQAYHTRSPTP